MEESDGCVYIQTVDLGMKIAHDGQCRQPCTKVYKCLPPASPDDVDELAERKNPLHEILEKSVEIAEANSEYHYPGDSCFERAHLTCHTLVSRHNRANLGSDRGHEGDFQLSNLLVRIKHTEEHVVVLHGGERSQHVDLI